MSFNKGKKIVRMVGFAIIGILIALGFALIFGIVVQYLWNWVMVDIFKLPVITFWQAFGLIILAKILFGGFGHHHHNKSKDYSNSHFHKHFGCSDMGSNDEADISDDMAYLFRHKHLLKKFWQAKGREEFRKFKEAQETQQDCCGE